MPTINITLPTHATTPPLHHRRSPALAAKLATLALPLAPLVRLQTGGTHPAFPRRLLDFWLLSAAQLDALAAFYHQRTPCQWTACYPCPVLWEADAPLEVKRRRLGRFIGLRGCETPDARATSREERERDVAREIERRRAANEEREMWRRKGMWY